ncbi:MAG: 3-deoxy-D-manno-octulosonic acid transferase [Gemmatimonadota bacterium]
MSAGVRLSAFAANTAVALRPLIRIVWPDISARVTERQAAERELLAWGPDRGDGRLVWVHGASAGELLGVAPALAELQERFPHTLLVTHFSPSGAHAARRLNPDIATFPPLDVSARCRAVMEAVRPDLLAYARTDVWPCLTAAAGAEGVPTALINGVVRSGSRRLRWPARPLFRSTYARLDAVGAVSEEDAGRLRRLGVRPAALRITGDVSVDQARARARAALAPGGLAAEFERALPDRPDVGRRLIAGSTWEVDETALLDALEALPASAGGRFGWQLVIAPHEPSESHVERLIEECRRRSHPVARWTDRAGLTDLPPHGVVVFDEMGTLADLYTCGDVAYVGGGLGGAGLHNVLEPAAAGLPVVFGSRHDRRDAAELLDAGGGFSCDRVNLASVLTRLGERETREAAGRSARDCVARGSGAATATVNLLERVLDRGS